MKIPLGVVGGLSFLYGIIGFFASKRFDQASVGAAFIAAGLTALAGAAIVDAVEKLRKTISDRAAAPMAPENVDRDVEALRAEVKALRAEIDGRADARRA